MVKVVLTVVLKTAEMAWYLTSNLVAMLVIKWLARDKAKIAKRANSVLVSFGKAFIVFLLLSLAVVLAVFQIFDSCPWTFK